MHCQPTAFRVGTAVYRYFFMHGTADDYVFPVLSERMHDAMIDAGTSPVTCLYVPMQDLNHSEGIVPAGLAGLEFFKTYR